ncbi:hypothetical protein PanWU01x14_284540 [Parasponia andersonii]|uniref:Transmembrane protein n=1 Tax=Parasponia andersonii TaxID=3476 RepID=A0A2P5AZU2_PARAD|nr:hypothetical protein PanWU01x14_284540 [Parasponia andersonii]
MVQKPMTNFRPRIEAKPRFCFWVSETEEGEREQTQLNFEPLFLRAQPRSKRRRWWWWWWSSWDTLRANPAEATRSHRTPRVVEIQMGVLYFLLYYFFLFLGGYILSMVDFGSGSCFI